MPHDGTYLDLPAGVANGGELGCQHTIPSALNNFKQHPLEDPSSIYKVIKQVVAMYFVDCNVTSDDCSHRKKAF